MYIEALGTKCTIAMGYDFRGLGRHSGKTLGAS